MNFYAATGYRPSKLLIGVEVFEPKTVYLVVRDAKNPLTQYTNRYMTISDKADFEVYLPTAPKQVEVVLASEQEVQGGRKDNQYRIYKARRDDLYSGHFNFQASTGRSDVDSFVKFAEEFASKASYASAAGSVYVSDDGKYRILYLDQIVDRGTGRKLKTPARISRTTGQIEISKKHFKQYTVPMRMAILLHEFSHFYLNNNSADEVEADLNALAIYLERGYPTVDAYNVFTQVFAESPTDLNKSRYQRIDSFIKTYR